MAAYLARAKAHAYSVERAYIFRARENACLLVQKDISPRTKLAEEETVLHVLTLVQNAQAYQNA